MHLVAIVVAYYPDFQQINHLIDSLCSQVNSIVIIDNTPASENDVLKAFENNECITLISLGENRGIATAQNIGIAYARKQEATDIILFDQDSIPTQTLIAD